MPDTARLAEMIARDFYDDGLDLSARDMASGTAWSRMPGVKCVQQLRAFGTPDRSVRLFVTFVSAMNRARDATVLWRAGVKLFEPAFSIWCLTSRPSGGLERLYS